MIVLGKTDTTLVVTAAFPEAQRFTWSEPSRWKQTQSTADVDNAQLDNTQLNGGKRFFVCLFIFKEHRKGTQRKVQARNTMSCFVVCASMTCHKNKTTPCKQT